MKKSQYITLLAAAILPTYATAADFSYTYAQASYISSDFAGADGDGFALDGSFELNKDFALIAGYETTSYDEFGVSLDIDVLALGVAFHMPVDEKMDAVFTGGLLDAEMSLDVNDPFFGSFSISGDDTGNFLSAGIRLQANPQMELGLALKRYDMFDEAETGIDASLLFNLDKKNQLGLSFSNIGEADNLFFRFRTNF